MTVVFLTSASSSPWSRPPDWADAGHTVELVGCGGNGGAGGGGGGGGGGGYNKLAWSSVGLSSTTTFAVKASNTLTTTAGQDTNGTFWEGTGTTNTYEAQAGMAGIAAAASVTTASGGIGQTNGTPASGTYTTTPHTGGAGGTTQASAQGGCGGGGSAGPSGNGLAGGAFGTSSFGAGGGGGCNNQSSTAGAQSGVAAGGAGGQGPAGTGSGAGGTTGAGSNATAGLGGGGGGGAVAASGSSFIGGAGAQNPIWTQTSDSSTAGPGGGGGGGAYNNINATIAVDGGNGSNYGGGGGGGGRLRSGGTQTGGTAGGGIIVITYTPAVTVFAAFSDNPIVVRKPTPERITRSQDYVKWTPGLYQAKVTPDGVFNRSPAIVRGARVSGATFRVVQPPPPQPAVFSESQRSLVKPFRTALERTGFDDTFLLIAYNPLIWGAYSESPYQLRKPTPSLLPWVDFPWQPIALRPLVFSESPTRTRPAFQLKQWSDISFLQIAYTPSALSFAESPWKFQPAKAFDQPGFVSFTIAVPTPASWGMFSESQWAFKKPTPLLAWGDVPFLPTAVQAFNEPFADSPFFFRYQVVFSDTDYAPQPIAPTAVTVTAFDQSPYPVFDSIVLAGTFNLPFVPTAVTTPSFWPWSESPTALKRPKALQQFADIAFLQIAYTPSNWGQFSEPQWRIIRPKPFDQPGFVFFPPAATPSNWGMFSEPQWRITKPRPLYPWADYPFLPISLVPLVFAESPTRNLRPKALLPFSDIAFLQIAYTPSTWGQFSESQWTFTKPRPLYSWSDISFVQIAYTPSALTFSESPYALRLPKPTEQQPWWFFPIAVATPSSWGMFSESPYQLKRPFQLNQFADIAFVQISYTPGPLVFSESQWTFKQPKPFEQQPFEFLPTVAVTPAAWGMFSESPWWFRRPFQLNAFADIAFFQIAYTPSIWGMFSESPYALTKPKPELVPPIGMPTLPIALIPLVFGESPTRRTPPFLLNQFSDISFLQIAYTPSGFGFSESQWRFQRPFLLNQFSDISFLQIAYTPSALVFAESQWTNRNVTQWKQRLDQPSIMPTVPPTAAATPSAFGFSESPTHITTRWIGAAQLELGNWGWAFPPPVVTAKVWEWHIRYRRRGRR